MVLVRHCAMHVSKAVKVAQFIAGRANHLIDLGNAKRIKPAPVSICLLLRCKHRSQQGELLAQDTISSNFFGHIKFMIIENNPALFTRRQDVSIFAVPHDVSKAIVFAGAQFLR